MGQKRLRSESNTRADLQIELLVAWLSAALGFLSNLGQVVCKSASRALFQVGLFLYILI